MHEGQKDAELAQQINGLLTQPIAIHSYQSPTEIKGVIGTAHLVISSRFHGLVSALSQGVPAIATGWSHKYEMLMQEYGCSELLLDANNPNLIATLDIGLTDASYQALKQEIAARSDALKQQSKHMWQQVIKAIKA